MNNLCRENDIKGQPDKGLEGKTTNEGTEELRVLYLPIGVGTFNQELAATMVADSKALLAGLYEKADLHENFKLISPDGVLLSTAALGSFIESLEEKPDLVILQNTTFANAAYAELIGRSFDCPIVIWTPDEEALAKKATTEEVKANPIEEASNTEASASVDDDLPNAPCGSTNDRLKNTGKAAGSLGADPRATRLNLNSLTGAFSASNMLASLGKPVECWIFGNPGEDMVGHKLAACVAAAGAKKALGSLRLLAVGEPPEGFLFGKSSEEELKENFGVTMLSVPAQELMARAREVSDERLPELRQEADAAMNGLDKLPAKNVDDFLKLYEAYRTYIEENQVGALSSRCWPNFFTEYGTPVCAVLGMLNDLGIAAACEADTIGALSMFLGMHLSGGPVFFGDPVGFDQDENALVFWHCGTGACSLARKDEALAPAVPAAQVAPAAKVGVHCNRKIGPTLEFGTKPSSEATVFRIGRKTDGTFRLFAAEGECLDVPQRYFGTSSVIRLKEEARPILEKMIDEAWEPHFVIAYKNIKEELKLLMKMLG